MKRKISYAPFFRTMKEKKISTYRLFKMGLNNTTYYRIKDGGSITMETVCYLCELLDCNVSDIVECVPIAEEDAKVLENEENQIP